MRRMIFMTGLCLSLLAGAAFADEEFMLIGAGVITATSPYRGVGTQSMALPIAVWEFKNFYLKGVEAGYHFYRTDRLQLSVFTSPRLMGYHSSDSDDLAGMEDRKMSLDAGVKAEIPLPWEGRSLNVKVMNDTLSRYKGWVAELSLSHELKGRIWRLTPSLGARVQSGRMTDYYFGVRSTEAQANRPEYEPGAAVNYFADAVFSIFIAKDWMVVTKGSLESLDSGIRKSPIVTKDVLFTGVVGLTRRF